MNESKITFKNVKLPGIGLDGQRYSASIYFEGKRVGTIENDGCGGPDDIRFVSKETRTRVWDYLKSVDSEANVDFQIEILFGKELDRKAVVKELRRFTYKKISFFEGTWKGEASQFRLRDTTKEEYNRMLAHVRRIAPKATVINELSKEEQLTLFQA